MRLFRLQILLLVLTGAGSLLLHAQVNPLFIQIPLENASDSSSHTLLPFFGLPGSAAKPVIIHTGAGNGGDDPGHWPGGSPPIPILVFGNVPPSASKSGKKDSSPGKESKALPEPDKDKTAGREQEQKHSDHPGAGNTPPADSEMDSMLAETMSMLDTLDILFEQSDVIITLLLDLDGTILARDSSDRDLQQALRERFKIFVERWRSRGRLKLVIVTGAKLKAEVAAFFSEHQLPVPDVIIANPVGLSSFYHVEFFSGISPGVLFPLQPIISGVHVTDSSLTIDNYYQFLGAVADHLPELLRQRGFGEASVQARAGQSMVHEISFSQVQDFSSEQRRLSIQQLVFSLCGILAKVEFEAEKGTVRVVLPMTKGGSVSHLASILPLAGAQVIAAGDDRIDYSMMVPAPGSSFAVYLAIMVSNARRGLREVVRDVSGELLHRAQRPCLLGVIEGLLAAMKKRVPLQE